MSASKIEVQGVSKEFDQAGSPVQALAALDFAVSEGEFVSIVGPSGCGKSTLLYMLGGFHPGERRPNAGRRPPDHRARRRSRRRVPGIRAVSVAHGFRQHRLRPAGGAIARARGPRHGRTLHPPDRPRRFRAPVSARAVGRNEAARGARADICLRAEHPAARRAVRRARCADPRDHAGRVAAAVAQHAQDRHHGDA